MANDFVNIQGNQSSDKFLLVRIEPARCLNSSLTLDSGSIYKADFFYNLSKVLVNGSTYTKVNGIPTANQYYFDETTGEFKIFLSGAPSNSVVVIAYYYLFYTGNRFRVLGKDPEVPTVDLREWEPRISSPPTITQDIKNVLNGILSISNSSLTIINNEDYFEQYISDNDSFYNKSILVWQCLDSTDNIKKIFSGKITSLSVNKTSVTFDIKDDLASLQSPASMGDSEIYFTNDYFTNVDPNKEGAPVRFIFGTSSRYKTIASPIGTLADAQRLDPEFMNEAVCTNFTNDISTSNNRDYGICRVGANGFEVFGFTPSSVDNSDPDYTRLTGTSAEIIKFTIGDTFSTSGSGTYYARVLFVDRTNNFLYCTKMASFIVTDSVISNNCPSIVIEEDSNDYYPLYGRDYTASVSTTSGGNKLLEITFVNNFEAALSMNTLNPQSMIVTYKVKPERDDQLHGKVLNSLLTSAGLTINSASITAANTSFPVNAAFSIPFFDEQDYSQYYKYIQELLQSTLGYIFLNNSFEIQYDLFSTPTSTSEVSEGDILINSYSIRVDYNDIVTLIVGYNPHFSSSEYIDKSSASASNPISGFLHGLQKTTRFRHVLEDFSTKINDHINLRSQRYAEYIFKTKQLNYLSQIGDDYLLTEVGLPSQSSSRSIKILSTSKSTDQTSIKASDLYNI